MTEQEIIEGNKLIAGFMGADLGRIGIAIKYPENLPNWAYQLNDFDMLKIGGYEYPTSWDWLMPVVKKISAMHNKETGPYFWPKDGDSGVDDFRIFIELEIAKLFADVVQFIKWYNSK